VFHQSMAGMILYFPFPEPIRSPEPNFSSNSIDLAYSEYDILRLIKGYFSALFAEVNTGPSMKCVPFYPVSSAINLKTFSVSASC